MNEFFYNLLKQYYCFVEIFIFTFNIFVRYYLGKIYRKTLAILNIVNKYIDKINFQVTELEHPGTHTSKFGIGEIWSQENSDPQTYTCLLLQKSVSLRFLSFIMHEIKRESAWKIKQDYPIILHSWVWIIAFCKYCNFL